MSNKLIGRVHNQQRSRRSQRTLELQEMVGRINNQLDEDAGLKHESHKQEIGVVNNEIRRAFGSRKTHTLTSQLIGRVYNQWSPKVPTA
ncbi:MAG: hypothetical protein WBW94_15395 [Anaerolineales bacterium]